MSRPVIRVYLIPEMADLGEVLDRGGMLHVVRFDHGMRSGQTSVGIGIQEVVDHVLVTRMVQTSMDALRLMMSTLETADGRGVDPVAGSLN